MIFYYHPIASFCWKVLIGLYERDVAFTKATVDLGNDAEREAFLKLSPLGKMPALLDGDRVVLETTIILEYLERRHPGLFPSDPDRLLECRALDRFYDGYVQGPMQKIVGDKLRPEDKRDPFGVAEAHAQLDAAYAVVEKQMHGRTWALGDDFSLADCAAAPALYYADRVHPLAKHTLLAAYLDRLHARPSFARVFEEAKPLMHLFPG
jgi:glutathione S-transferase